MRKTPICKKCSKKGKREILTWNGFASMGGSHSNYYICSACGHEVEIYDRDLDDSDAEF